jgi:toxin-antitoxin system PIN domain toxin
VRHLLDVNVLIALIDPTHVGHDAAHRWFAAEGAASWATCPLTENGVIRIVGHPKYPNSAGSPAAVVPIMARLRALPGHLFWKDDFSLIDSAIVDASRIATSAQVTDAYLLALAVANNGRLATFDRRLSPQAVRRGGAALYVIGGAENAAGRSG